MAQIKERLFSYTSFYVVLFTQEVFLDYEDYDQPFHSRTKIIEQLEIAYNSTDDDYGLNEILSSKITQEVQLNTAKRLDTPWISPWLPKTETKTSFLTSGKRNVKTVD